MLGELHRNCLGAVVIGCFFGTSQTHAPAHERGSGCLCRSGTVNDLNCLRLSVQGTIRIAEGVAGPMKAVSRCLADAIETIHYGAVGRQTRPIERIVDRAGEAEQLFYRGIIPVDIGLQAGPGPRSPQSCSLRLSLRGLFQISSDGVHLHRPTFLVSLVSSTAPLLRKRVKSRFHQGQLRAAASILELKGDQGRRLARVIPIEIDGVRMPPE